MQALSLDSKIRMTQQRIKQWYDAWDGMVYVSFSGGKDSTVLKHIVDSMYDDVPSLFVNTGLEYPEIQRFAMSQKNVVTVRPSMRFDEVIKKYGYPVISKQVAKKAYDLNTARRHGNFNSYVEKQFNGTYTMKNGEKSKFNIEKWKFLLESDFSISHMCCDVMKKKPSKEYEKMTGRKPIIGTMASESKLRYNAWLQHGCNAFDADRPKSQPLSFWTEQDIYHYIKKFNVPYCSEIYGEIVVDDRPDGNDVLEGQINLIDYLGAYGEQERLTTTKCNRTGCIFCMFGCHLEKEPNRFQQLKLSHPKQYKFCIGGVNMMKMANGNLQKKVWDWHMFLTI